MSTVCYCGQPTCPVTEWNPGACINAAQAEVTALRARVAELEALYDNYLWVSGEMYDNKIAQLRETSEDLLASRDREAALRRQMKTERDAAQAEVTALRIERDCLMALASTNGRDTYLPLHWREAVARGDVEACRELAAKADATYAKLQKDAEFVQSAVDKICHYRNLAIVLGAKPDQMEGQFDRQLCEKGIDKDDTSNGYHASVQDTHDWLAETWRDLERVEAERDEWKARVAELEARTAPIPGVTDGSREHEPYTLEEVALIEAQRGKAYSRLRVTVQRMRALATNHQMLLGGDMEEFIALPQKSGIAVLEFRDKRKAAEAERDEWKARAEAADLRRIQVEESLHAATTSLDASLAREREAAAQVERLREALTMALRHLENGANGSWSPYGFSRERDRITAALSEPIAPWLRERDRALAMRVAKAVRATCAVEVESRQWHPGGVRGAINPRQAAEAIRASDLAAIVDSCLQEKQ